MHWMVNLRDIFWFRQAPMTGNRVYDAMPLFQRRPEPPPDIRSGDPQSREKVNNSALDRWQRRIQNLFTVGRSHKSVLAVLAHLSTID